MIRKITPEDRTAVIEMMTDFYSSEAVLAPVSTENFEKTVDECLNSDVYADLYVAEVDDRMAGYALTAKTFSNEAGGMVTWIEELYVCPSMRGHNIGHELLTFLLNTDSARFRLETEEENVRAVKLYKSFGFMPFGYDQMILEGKK